MRFVNEIFFSPFRFGFGNFVGVVTNPQIVFAIPGKLWNYNILNGNVNFGESKLQSKMGICKSESHELV